jgi:hypothetical protein
VTVRPRPPLPPGKPIKVHMNEPTWALVTFESAVAARLALAHCQHAPGGVVAAASAAGAAHHVVRVAGLSVRALENYRSRLAVRWHQPQQTNDGDGDGSGAVAASSSSSSSDALVEVIPYELLQEQTAQCVKGEATSVAEAIVEAARPRPRSAGSVLAKHRVPRAGPSSNGSSGSSVPPASSSSSDCSDRGSGSGSAKQVASLLLSARSSEEQLAKREAVWARMAAAAAAAAAAASASTSAIAGLA